MVRALDMYSIGIGPSSSHTIGPMKAAFAFVSELISQNKLIATTKLNIHFYGSLALTGEGHGTIIAMLNGLCGEVPKTTDPELFISRANGIKDSGEIKLFAQHLISFDYQQDILLHSDEFLPQHSNGMRFVAYSGQDVLLSREYFSVGGGFVLDDIEITQSKSSQELAQPYLYHSGAELTHICKENNLTIAEVAYQNELADKSLEETNAAIDEIITVMHNSIVRGISTQGILPGGLNLRRRANNLFSKINTSELATNKSNLRMMAITYAIAVNEENAAFSKIVTAPTNGSAGTIAGVLEYYKNFIANDKSNRQQQLRNFILTAGAIGVLYKEGASISAAEVGCQGEIGVACSMAAAGLVAVLGGNIDQVTKAAEIAMEHSLGMTCDPINGLVQVPCIERNGVAVTRAIDISELVMLEPEPGIIDLDRVIKAMYETGKDMNVKYKETSLAGLAISHALC